METDKQLIVNLALDRIEGEGDWCLPTECHVGEDDD
jgi:hypothetical protein